MPPVLGQLRRLRRFRRHCRRSARRCDERGDVPGWVLVTLMTVSIGMALWGIAEPQLVSILRAALDSVR